ncbi:EboA domain-containing protein [Streptomyces sp. NPDC052101]|uniref:EboA domain-containing protein n=1 Tax=Streptomyces sp. NPDC052101 TaxID=3155763 RepID=UPI003423A33D
MEATTASPVHDPLVIHTLNATLRSTLTPGALDWLEESSTLVAKDITLLGDHYRQADPRCGRRPLPGWRGWSRTDGARARLLMSAEPDGPELVATAGSLYLRGDPAERRGILHALPFLAIGNRALPIVDDALDTDDSRLVRAALGPYAGAYLDQTRWRQAVVKCLTMGIPLIGVAGLDKRRDAELARMGEAFARRQRTAGRPVPPDVWLITRPR